MLAIKLLFDRAMKGKKNAKRTKSREFKSKGKLTKKKQNADRKSSIFHQNGNSIFWSQTDHIRILGFRLELACNGGS